MKYLTILLLSFPAYSLDLTIPELPYDYEVEPIVEKRLLNLGDYQEPPTRGQLNILLDSECIRRMDNSQRNETQSSCKGVESPTTSTDQNSKNSYYKN